MYYIYSEFKCERVVVDAIAVDDNGDDDDENDKQDSL